MRDLANYDMLTGVANRQFFEFTLTEWLHDANKEQPLALLLIDLDNFKSVNDTLGHHVGDRLLKTLSRRISGCLRRSDFIARLGGDEFVTLLKINDNFNIDKITQKINQTLATPFELGEYHVETSCSIGISFYPKDGTTCTELLKNADIAMYQAKKNGRNQSVLFSETKLHTHSKQRHIIKRDLKDPSLFGQLHLDYQPLFDLDSTKIIGFEAFLRWQHPRYGLLTPKEVIPLAEQTGSIYSLGYWVIEQALLDFKTVMLPASEAKLSLNIALTQLNDKHFVDHLCENINRHELDSNLVILDIAEKVSILHNRSLDQHLQAIRSQGIQLSLDNYGSADSTLSQLLEVPVNFIKIDQNYLHTLDSQPRHKAFIGGLIDFANKLDLQVIQKGVENEPQNKLLKDLGCQFAQGYYYCPPLPIDSLEVFLSKYKKST